MSEEISAKPIKTFVRAGVEFGACPICGGVLPVVTLSDDGKVLVQPEPVPAIEPMGAVVDLHGQPVATSPQKLLQSRGRLRAQCFVPHAFLCPGLIQMGMTPPLLRWVVPPQPCPNCHHFRTLHGEDGKCRCCECSSTAATTPQAQAETTDVQNTGA